ncbi:MAG: transporter substrate-binding domain-containing protein [Planctomycetota bacterium]|jgi:polar amino acid transport system substrate-binding protein
MRLLVGLAILLLAVSCGTKEYSSALDRILDRKVLVIGTEPEFPPFESLDENGDFVGFDMDLARELAKELGVELRIEAMSFDALMSALDTQRIDLIISGMTATAERAKSRAFTEPYFHTKLCLLVNVDSGIEKATDADGKRIAVKLGTTGDINAPILFPNAKITKYEREGECALEVVNRRVDAFLYDRHSILRHHRQHPTKTRAILEPLSEEPYAMATALKDPKFLERLNRFLADSRTDGRYARLYERHFGEKPDASR